MLLEGPINPRGFQLKTTCQVARPFRANANNPRAHGAEQEKAATSYASPPGPGRSRDRSGFGLVLIGQLDGLHSKRLSNIVKRLVADLMVAEVGKFAEIIIGIDIVHYLYVNAVRD